MHLYNLTLQKATAITHAIHGNFSGTKQQEIVISRGKIIEILRHDPNTGKVYTLLSEDTFSIIRGMLSVRLTGGNKGLNAINFSCFCQFEVFFTCYFFQISL
jgi:splicing factor 3B subunit 3